MGTKTKLRLKVFRNFVLGAALGLGSAWIMIFVGLMKRAFTSAEAFLRSGNNPNLRTWDVRYAAAHWSTIQWLGNDHKIIWHLAPLFPPPGFGAGMFSWPFLRANWLLLCWLVVLYGGVWLFASAIHISDLMSEVSREKKKNEIREAMGVTVPGSHQQSVTSVQIVQAQQILLQRAAESGKWWSLNGAIVGGALAALLAEVISIWLGLTK